MRVDDATPRTWLLATVAAWALLAWVLALAGLGGRVARLADDPGLLQPLPQPRPSPPDRLGPLSQYAEIAARPLFADDRRPHPFSLQQTEDDGTDQNAFDYVLTGVLLTPQLRMAIVQPSQGGESIRIKLDSAADALPDWRLVQLNPRSAVFEGPGGRKALDLRTFDGTGGIAPTALATPAEPAPADAVRDADSPVPVPTPPPASPMSQAAPIVEPRAGGTARPPAEDAKPLDPQRQMDAIRERIQARRAQLRREAEQATAPAKTP